MHIIYSFHITLQLFSIQPRLRETRRECRPGWIRCTKKSWNKNHCGFEGLRAAFLRTTPYLCFRKCHCLYLLPSVATDMTDWEHRWFTNLKQIFGSLVWNPTAFVSARLKVITLGEFLLLLFRLFLFFFIGINHELVARRLRRNIYLTSPLKIAAFGDLHSKKSND